MLFDKRKTYIMDGAMGTELQRRGFATTLPLWSVKALFEKPQLIKDIHKDYIKAGADIIVTCTFRTQKRTLAKGGLENDWERINKLAVQLAHEARRETKTENSVLIAASVTTLEDCYEPESVPPNNMLAQEHAEQIQLLAGTDIDLFLLETFNTIREAEAAARAAKQTAIPFIMSFTLNKAGNLLSGEPLAAATQTINPYRPAAYGVNCVPPAIADKGLHKLGQTTNLPLAVFANGDGEAGSDLGWKFDTSDHAQSYAQKCKEWKAVGATIIGGCCGTNPRYTQQYHAALHN